MYDEDPPTLLRLNALMKAGFVIDEAYSQHVENSLELKHPAIKRLDDYELTLYPDGLLVGSCIGDQLRIEPEQQKEFNSFLRSVPKPTWLEKSLDLRVKMFTWFATVLHAAMDLYVRL